MPCKTAVKALLLQSKTPEKNSGVFVFFCYIENASPQEYGEAFVFG